MTFSWRMMGMDFCIPQKEVVTKGNMFLSHKYAGTSALSYKLGVRSWGGEPGVDPGPIPRP